MADFSALKAAIQAAIRQNGNNEITGNIMQGILLSMVNTLGDAAINALVDAVAALSARVADGYMYGGIATPTGTPAASSGKVFYIALQAGTYTHYGSLVVTQGINILKTDNVNWTLEVVWSVDSVPTLGSNNLVESGGVVSWGEENYGRYIKAPGYVQVITDLEGKTLEAIKSNGTKVIGADLEVGGNATIGGDTTILGKVDINGATYTLLKNPEWVQVLTDAQDRVIAGVRKDGSVYINKIDGLSEEVQQIVNTLFANKSTLDKFSEIGGKICWQGVPVGEDINVIKTLLLPWEGSHATKILSVKKDGTGDFTSIQEAINSITDASVINQYEVQVYDDFYINDLTELWKVDNPTEHITSSPTEDGAYIITKDWVHLRGVGGKREIYVDSPNADMDGSCFQYIQTIFVTGNCRIENFTFKVKGGRYAVHQDMSAYLSGPDSYKTTIYKDLDIIHMGNQDYTNGNSGWSSQCAQANGVANGQTQFYINVSWETRSNVIATAFYVHTNAEYTLPCKMVMINCRSIGLNGLTLPSWGGFGFEDLYSCQNNDVFVFNCNIPQYGGRTMGQAIQSKAPQTAATKRYCFNRFIGHGNKPFVVKKETAKVLSFETKNQGESINVIGGTAYDDLWGLTYLQENGSGIKGICYGGNYVEPGTYSQVHNLAYILGNCASNPKTLIVEITDSRNNKTQHTITFNQNYMTSDGSAYSYNTTPYISQADIIAAVNTAFSSYFTMGDSMDFVDSFEDCKEEVFNKGSVVAELGTMMKKDYSLGYRCWRVANEGENPDGVAMSRIGLNSIGWVLLLNKNLFDRELFGVDSLLTTGTLYKVGANGTIIETSEVSEGVLIAVDNSTITKI